MGNCCSLGAVDLSILGSHERLSIDSRSTTEQGCSWSKPVAEPGPETRKETERCEARDLSEAIQVASKIPPGRLGCIEVRPIQELEIQE